MVKKYDEDDIRIFRESIESSKVDGLLDDSVKEVIVSGIDEGDTPLLFRVPLDMKSFQVLANNGVDLTQRDQNGNTLLFDDVGYDLETFKWLCAYFSERGAIDLPEKEGITPLSLHIKLGDFDKARILLEFGASTDTFGIIERYGFSRLDIPTQAINCIPTGPNENQEEMAIEALGLLKEFGLTLTKEEKETLIKKAEQKGNVVRWITDNF